MSLSHFFVPCPVYFPILFQNFLNEEKVNMVSNNSASGADDVVKINENLFQPGVLDYIRTLAKNKETKILLLFKETGEKVIAAFVEVGKIIKQIIFVPAENRNSIKDSFAATFFISAKGKISFA